MASLLSARFFCEHCQKETHFLSTIYYWMDRHWIHWRELPSRRRVICKESLSHEANTKPPSVMKHFVPKCPIPSDPVS
jgi:hypothetical protein